MRSDHEVDSVNLDELRRRAFSRHGTESDLRAFVEAQASSVELELDVPVVEPATASETADSESSDAERSADMRHRNGGPVWVAIAGVVGLAVGALVNPLQFTVAPPENEPTSQSVVSSLTIFDHDDERPVEAVPLGAFEEAGYKNVEVRFLDQVRDGSVYVARVDIESHNVVVGVDGKVVTSVLVNSPLVCLIYAHAVAGSTWACDSLDAFNENGLENPSGNLMFRWGPTGTELWVSEN